MTSVLAGLKQRAAKFTPKQLVAAGVLAAVILTAAIFLVRWVTAPTYDVLFSGLETADAAAVTQAIEATGVGYKVVENGTTSTIMVPAENATDLRMTLAAENLPNNSVVGYELLDNQGVTVSTFREQVNYQRALEGELSRTLTSLEDVAKASVHIVLPKERLYTDDEEPATASVTVSTRGSLDDDEVNAITHLVASSVPGLSPDNVTVADSNGDLLSGTGAGSGEGNSAEQKAEAEYANRLETRATSMLTQVVGEGKAVVRVQADLDFTKRTRQQELFDPENVATDKEKVETEEYTSTQPGVGGLLTTDPEENDQQQNNATNEYDREAAERDFAVSREITSETDAPGEVRRMTVSVLLDPALGNAQADQVEALVSNAVGFDAERGDQLAVEFLQFIEDEEPGPDPSIAAAEAEQRTKLIVGLSVAGVLLLGILLLGFALLRGRRKNNDEDDDSVTALTTAESLTAASTVDPNAPLGVPSSSGGQADRLRERVAERPADAADVIRGLLASDEVGRK